MAFDGTAYKKDFAKTNYSKFSFYVAKDKADELRALAKREGKSVNLLLQDAIKKLYNLDLSK